MPEGGREARISASSDVRLGNENDVRHRGKHQDILPGDVIGAQEQGTPAVELAMDADAQAEQQTGDAMPVTRQPAPRFQIEPEAKNLDRISTSETMTSSMPQRATRTQLIIRRHLPNCASPFA